MDFDFFKYYSNDKINNDNAWEVIAKRNNPSFKKSDKFFFASCGTFENSQTNYCCLIPINTKKGFDFFSKDSTPIPFDLYNIWIETHPNQRIYSCETLFNVIDNGFITEDFLSEIKELIVKVPKEYKDKMF